MWFMGKWETDLPPPPKKKKARLDLSWVKILQTWISAGVNLC